MASALSIADTLQFDDGEVSVDLPYAALAILATGRRDRIFYRIAGPAGALITGYADLATELPLARAAAPTFANISYHGTALRAAVLGRFFDSVGGNWVTVVVAHSRDERRALAGEIFANAFLPVLLMALVAGGLLWFGVRRALAPLATVGRLVGEREPADLTPIEMPVPAEVRELLTALNRFMQRLQANLGLMQTFLADAAHQIRTPLAALRAQADLAAEEDDAVSLRSYVGKIQRNAALASQVTNQLLSHTMVAHRSQMVARQRVDLRSLLRQVTQHAEAGGICPPIELDLRELTSPAIIEGDPITLREAFANLLDNARNYAGDRETVQIRVRPANNGRTLQVEFLDRGPGIPEAEKARVLQRFVRGTSGERSAGSGLGLAIVKAVVDAHGGELTLLHRQGGGLVVRLILPALRDPVPPRVATFVLLLMLLAPTGAGAAQSFDYPAVMAERGRLQIYAATDQALMEPLLRGFQAAHSDIAITYRDLTTVPLYRAVVEPSDGHPPDLVISSAMDLQAKLVNDGWTQPHVSQETLRVPDWANWRNEAYGFTLEPAVIVYRRGALAEAEVPHSRPELLRLLQGEPDRFRHRVATYDIAQSGVGYLFATQDSVLSSRFWRLTLALGELGVRLLPTSGEILDAIEHGDALIGYNVLGSYARAREHAGAAIGIIQPGDYTLVMSRVVAIPRAARQPVLAKLFIDYLLSRVGQQVIADTAGLQPLLASDEDGPPPATVAAIPITLGPALLVFLDRQKRERFLADWSAAVHQP